MAASDAKTIMTGAKTNSNLDAITNYALFMGGTNVTHNVLQAYDPLRTGFGRIFMVRKPVFVDEYFKDTQDMAVFKHILEYGNTAISGISDISIGTNTINGGYTGKGFDIPSTAEDSTNRLTITVYDFSGSPIRKVLHTWMNGMVDFNTNLTHYNGIANVPRIQANQTAEFVYVSTDHTGENVEYACLFANCWPTSLNLDPFNYTAGQHELVQTQVEFSAVKYESIQINILAKALLDKYKVLSNSLNFFSGYKVENGDITPVSAGNDGTTDNNQGTGTFDGAHYDETDGMLKPKPETRVSGSVFVEVPNSQGTI